MLYHINLGAPVLGEGSKVIAPIATLTPKDELSAGEVDTWNEIGPPQTGYSERVYFATLAASEHGQTAVMLRDAQHDTGLGVRIDQRTLPHFVLWKNTAAETDGYVIGLEPATNLPNARSYEASQGRVVRLAGGESVVFRVGLEPLINRDQVAAFEEEIAFLGGDR
jgi:galactose mutarotase-like enzyme